MTQPDSVSTGENPGSLIPTIDAGARFRLRRLHPPQLLKEIVPHLQNPKSLEIINEILAAKIKSGAISANEVLALASENNRKVEQDFSSFWQQADSETEVFPGVPLAEVFRGNIRQIGIQPLLDNYIGLFLQLKRNLAISALENHSQLWEITEQQCVNVIRGAMDRDSNLFETMSKVSETEQRQREEELHKLESEFKVQKLIWEEKGVHFSSVDPLETIRTRIGANTIIQQQTIRREQIPILLGLANSFTSSEYPYSQKKKDNATETGLGDNVSDFLQEYSRKACLYLTKVKLPDLSVEALRVNPLFNDFSTKLPSDADFMIACSKTLESMYGLTFSQASSTIAHSDTLITPAILATPKIGQEIFHGQLVEPCTAVANFVSEPRNKTVSDYHRGALGQLEKMWLVDDDQDIGEIFTTVTGYNFVVPYQTQTDREGRMLCLLVHESQLSHINPAALRYIEANDPSRTFDGRNAHPPETSPLGHSEKPLNNEVPPLSGCLLLVEKNDGVVYPYVPTGNNHLSNVPVKII